MRRSLLLLTVLLAMSFLRAPSTVLAQGPPYYAINQTFAISPIIEAGRYPISTFIPRSLLLFVPDRQRTVEVSGKKYLQVTTQDGVKALVDPGIVSARPFPDSRGRQNTIIFNGPFDLCREIGCDKNDSDEVWTVAAGEAFQPQKAGVSGLLQLRGFREGTEITGYIRDEELGHLIATGVVTNTTDHHPRYQVARRDASSANTECGEIRTTDKELSGGAGLELDLSLLKAFGLGAKAEVGGRQVLKYTKSYGGKERRFTFTEYTFTDTKDTKASFVLATQTVYVCSEGAYQPSRYIERVDLLNTSSQRPYQLTIDAFKTPTDLQLKTGGLPYLFSINNADHYTDLMERLGRYFEDRAVAGYILSQFNRSCSALERNSDKCQKYSYRVQ